MRRGDAIRAAVTAAAGLFVIGCGAQAGASRSPATVSPSPPTASVTGAASPPPAPAPHAAPARRAVLRAPFAVGLRVVTIVDNRRHVRFPGRTPVARKLVTLVRYPAVGSASRVDVAGARPAVAAGPFPLVVFGHGYAVTPAIYARLLQAWARAGYVVAAPVFPLENADAPGGPDESDLVNQPRDMSLVISRMLAASGVPSGFFAGLIDAQAIAVSGQSDGGETALAVAYDRYYLDRRVTAAMILSGAKIPGVGGFDFPAPSPPLLATQGTADVVNPPSLTHAFYDLAPRPKYLLSLFGASHLGPYTTAQPQLGIVERSTVAFLDLYLKRAAGAAARLTAAGDVARTSVLQTHP